jgi:hypothetical protein
MFTLGNISALAATCFLVGPKKQWENMRDRDRWSSALTFTLAMIGTLVASIHVRAHSIFIPCHMAFQRLLLGFAGTASSYHACTDPVFAMILYYLTSSAGILQQLTHLIASGYVPLQLQPVCECKPLQLQTRVFTGQKPALFNFVQLTYLICNALTLYIPFRYHKKSGIETRRLAA